MVDLVADVSIYANLIRMTLPRPVLFLAFFTDEELVVKFLIIQILTMNAFELFTSTPKQ